MHSPYCDPMRGNFGDYPKRCWNGAAVETVNIWPSYSEYVWTSFAGSTISNSASTSAITR